MTTGRRARRRLACALGLHGSGLVGNRTPGPRAVRECLRCGRGWVGAYDGVYPFWRRVR